MADTYKIASGVLLLGGSSGSASSLFDGTGCETITLTKKATFVEVEPLGTQWAESLVSKYEVDISATIYAPAGSSPGAYDLTVGDTVYATVKKDSSTSLFAGDCKVVDVRNDQKSKSADTITVTLKSAGEPDTF